MGGYVMELTKEKALEFTKKCISESNRPNYRFRSRYRHTLRVLIWAERLHKEIGGNLEVLTYSAILHDCAWNGLENHAITSCNKAKDFLNQFSIDENIKNMILEGVLYHNRNETRDLCKESYMLMDADELDEIGALCIMWDSLAEYEQNENTSYKSIVLRTKKYLPKLEENINKLHFDYSKNVYRKKLDFMREFVKEAEDELEIELKGELG